MGEEQAALPQRIGKAARTLNWWLGGAAGQEEEKKDDGGRKDATQEEKKEANAGEEASKATEEKKKPTKQGCGRSIVWRDQPRVSDEEMQKLFAVKDLESIITSMQVQSRSGYQKLKRYEDTIDTSFTK